MGILNNKSDRLRKIIADMDDCADELDEPEKREAAEVELRLLAERVLEVLAD